MQVALSTTRGARVVRANSPFDEPGFEFVDGEDFEADETLVPAEEGVLTVFVEGGNRVARIAGYFQRESKELLSFESRQHLFTDWAHNLRHRSRQLLLEPNGVSHFRKALLAADTVFGAISFSGTTSSDVNGRESRLTDWLVANATIGFRVGGDGPALKTRLLSRSPSPFNIVERPNRPFAQFIGTLAQEVYGGAVWN